ARLSATARSTATPRDARDFQPSWGKPGRDSRRAPGSGLQMHGNTYAPPSDGARAHGQLELFASAAVALPIVVAPRQCRCGSLVATLSSSRGPHAGELRCADGGPRVMWASHAYASEIRQGFTTGISSFMPGTRP